MTERTVYIAGASGSFLDSAIAVPQLLTARNLNYITFDYYTEGGVGQFTRAGDPERAQGFSPDFLDVQLGPNLREIAARGIKIVANSGGRNPRGLAELIRRRVKELGLALNVAAVDGANLNHRLDEFKARGLCSMFTGEPFPQNATGMNAYLGAFPAAHALAQGADIVITGRVVDSGAMLAPLIHEFGWGPTDYDLLAAGSVTGHLLECGSHVSGGIFTDWREVPDWTNGGFPIAECHADGSIVLTKPANTDGLISVGTVSEQLLYEVSDPQMYYLPDVVCDFSGVKIEQVGTDRVRVSGAKGYPPTSTYKVNVGYPGPWRNTALVPVIGVEAIPKARRFAQTLIDRTTKVLKARGLGDWKQIHREILGAEDTFGARARVADSREVICKVVVEHDQPEATDLLWRETGALIMNSCVGSTVPLAPVHSVRLAYMFECQLPKTDVPITVVMGDEERAFEGPKQDVFRPEAVRRPQPPTQPNDIERGVSVPLLSLAWARSGDKGNLFNVAVIARRPEYLPYIRAAMTPEAVGAWYAHFLANPAAPRVDRYDAPGVHALNFVVHESLARGIFGSPRLDSCAKGMGQQLLEFPIPVSRAVGRLAEDRLRLIDPTRPYAAAVA